MASVIVSVELDEDMLEDALRLGRGDLSKFVEDALAERIQRERPRGTLSLTRSPPDVDRPKPIGTTFASNERTDARVDVTPRCTSA